MFYTLRDEVDLIRIVSPTPFRESLGDFIKRVLDDRVDEMVKQLHPTFKIPPSDHPFYFTRTIIDGCVVMLEVGLTDNKREIPTDAVILRR